MAANPSLYHAGIIQHTQLSCKFSRYPEENRFNKFARASDDQSNKREEPAAEIKIPISSRDSQDKNRTVGLIGAQINP